MERALNTVRNMLEQREYTIRQVDEEKFIGTNEENKSIVVFTTLIEKFNVDRIKEKIVILNAINENHCIVIYNDSITSIAKKSIENSIDKKFELFTLDELQYNITTHRLVPKHVKLSDKEATVFKKRYGVKFPVILTTDPVSRFYNFQRGDIIKIIRKDSSTDFPFITHRIVK